MSTEVIETNLELMRDELSEFIQDENLDILDEFEADEVADLVISMAERLLHRDFCNGRFGHSLRTYQYKVNNRYKGFVSVSDDSSTGVSRTEFKPFYNDDDEGYFTGLCSLAEMINEAYYNCNND